MSSSPLIPSSETILPASAAGVARAAELLSQGKLVILPTETVYGIALNLLSPEARKAARQAKQQAQEPNAAAAEPGHSAQRFSPWVIHVAQPEDIFTWAPHLTPLARRLIIKSLPGPVAFQIKLDDAAIAAARSRLGDAADETLHNPEEGPERYLTVRCPDFALTQNVLDRVEQPVAIIGAGTRQQPAIYDLQDLPASLVSSESQIAAALDGGPTRYRKPSTVVRIDGNAYNVVRAGVIDGRLFDRLADFTIVFVCSGNTCRSPMAAALATKLIAEKLGVSARELPLRHIVVQSAGVTAGRGMRAALEAQDAVRNLGADLSAHLSQSASIDLLRRADVIYTMTDAHREDVLELFPGAERKTFRLDPEGDVADPIGAPLPVYERVAARLDEVIQERLNEWPL